MSASVIGTDHVRHTLPNQDACVTRIVDGRLIVVVSDGAGSARFADVGSQRACGATLAVLEAVTAPVDDLAVRVIAAVQGAIEVEALARAATPRDFACTLLAALVAEDFAVFVQVGDGAMVIATRAAPEQHAWVVWPDKGEHANETSFVTGSHAAADIEVVWRSEPIDELAVFTDGLERLALDFERRVAYPSFFGPMLGAARAADDPEAAGRDLAAFLDSPRVNARTSDDKTLVLASRRS